MKTCTVICSCINIIWLILTQIANANNKNLTNRIFGGNAINISQAKFVVQVISKRYGMISMCGGTLVTPLHVITAAHCVAGTRNNDITVIAGATYFQIAGHRRWVDSKYLHVGWDIAVLKLQNPLKGTNIATIPLCNARYKTDDSVQVYGWGQTSTEDVVDFHSRRTLREVAVPVVDRKECALYFNAPIPQYYFCAGVPDEKDSLGGDSGGPAVFNNSLCGVVSSGTCYPCMGLYVDINYVKDILKKYIEYPDHDTA